MKNYLQPGDVLNVPTAAAAVTSGQVCVVGTHIGIANTSAAIGEPYGVVLSGVYLVPKAAGAAWAQGQPLMWDASAGAFAAVGAPAAGDITAAGITAFAAAASADTAGEVRFAGVPGTLA